MAGTMCHMTTPIDTTTLTTGNWQPAIGTPGQVVLDAQDVDQCIRVIMATPKGSDPLRPRFGFDGWQYIDWPIVQARPHLVREVTNALQWEPRMVVDKVEVTLVDEAPYSNLAVLITWHFASAWDGEAYQTYLPLKRSA